MIDLADATFVECRRELDTINFQAQHYAGEPGSPRHDQLMKYQKALQERIAQFESRSFDNFMQRKIELQSIMAKFPCYDSRHVEAGRELSFVCAALKKWDEPEIQNQ